MDQTTDQRGVFVHQAPNVVRLSANFYIMYYCVSHISQRNSTINYGTSTDLLNWVNHGTTGITTQELPPASAYNAIDPSLILIGSQYYMVFGSYWAQLHVIPMENPPYRPVNYPAAVQQIERNPAATPVNATEAGYVYQYTPPGTATPYIYLFFSEGRANQYDTINTPAGTEYKIRVCRLVGPLRIVRGHLFGPGHAHDLTTTYTDHGVRVRPRQILTCDRSICGLQRSVVSLWWW